MQEGLTNLHPLIHVQFHFFPSCWAQKYSPQPPPPAFPEGHQVVPTLVGRYSLSSRSRVRPEASSLQDMFQTPHQGGVLQASRLDARTTSTDSALSLSWTTELPPLFLKMSRMTLRRKLISVACIQNLILSVTHRQLGEGKPPCFN